MLQFTDDATQVHLGRRTARDSGQAQKVMAERWMSWVGTPEKVVFDCGERVCLRTLEDCKRMVFEPFSRQRRGSEKRLRGMKALRTC